jgi:hypothetical protein
MAHNVPFIVAELGADAEPSLLIAIFGDISEYAPKSGRSMRVRRRVSPVLESL